MFTIVTVTPLMVLLSPMLIEGGAGVGLGLVKAYAVKHKNAINKPTSNKCLYFFMILRLKD